MDKAFETPRWAQVILWLIIGFGCTVPMFAEDFNPQTLADNTVIQVGVCEVSGEDGIAGTFICALVQGDTENTIYLLLFDTKRQELEYVVESVKNGEEVTATIVWVRKKPACEGMCA